MKFEYEKWRYGLFVHYIAAYAYDADFVKADDPVSAAEGFEVEKFAEDVSKMGVQYVVFTAWHALAQPLYPSEVTKRWRPGVNCAERDLIGEVIDALNAKGIHVILYTHPRDGHDFDEANRLATGWGMGHEETETRKSLDTPDFNNFCYEKWNKYTTELYAELLGRYGDRIEGIWVDGMGPGRFGTIFENSMPYEYPIVNYLDIRSIIKGKNPRIPMIQNMTGDRYNCDFAMPEMYYGMEHRTPYEDWPACRKALAFCPFGGWTPVGKKGPDTCWIAPEKLFEFMVLEATCASAGGMCLAASPYRGGEWETGAVEKLEKLGLMLAELKESFRGIVPSRSWPTVSGDTLRSKNYICAAESEDGRREFIHVLRIPEGGKVILPKPEDGASFRNPVIMAGSAKIASYEINENGIEIVLEGGEDSADNVIRLDRTPKAAEDEVFWINDTEQEIVYQGTWGYYCFCGDKQWCRGYYEYDEHSAVENGAKLQFAFDGDIVEIYGPKGQGLGTADVIIDNMKAGTINEFSENEEKRALLFRSTNLYGGRHTLRLIKTGGDKFSFDAAKIISFVY